ncbi:MAG TPA: RagB/SusD family nutrient uptake outer membrane protein [Prolixibacteraceae bacterium]|nr:RagB/SusD family nutrient uptake outer membrane protein [Prolixibacteraceae bacterium]
MKNKITIFLIVLLSSFIFSCKDYLDRPPYGVLTNDNFYQNPDQLLQALTDAYNTVGYYDFEMALFGFGDIMTDDALKGGTSDGDQRAMFDLSYFIALPSNALDLSLWKQCYQAIYKCNLVIEKAVKVESLNPVLVKRIVAEAKFMRGLYYYHLASTFGGLPLVTKPLDPSEMTVVRSTADETWNQIEKDFSEAANELPLKSGYTSADNGRATSGAANAMLAKTYLIRQKYAEAEAALKKVVSSGEYSLVNDFGKIWTKEFENSSESVFEIQHLATKTGWTDTEGTVINIFCTSRNNGGWGFQCPTEDLNQEFEPGDPRRIYTFTQTGDVFGGNDRENNSLSPTGFYNRKVRLGKDEQNWNSGSDQPYNVRYLRYADVLLLYAEVLNENGKQQEALIYLNMIRDRARASNPVDPRRIFQVEQIIVDLPVIVSTDKNELRKKIWHERRVELACEYHRRVDLIRQKRYGDIMRAYAQKWDTDKGRNFNDSYHYLCPIPQEEIDRSNLSISQNAGY